MKLFLTVVLASVLMMKTAEGAILGEACTADGGECTADSNTECVTLKCACKEGYMENSDPTPVCKKKAGEACEAADECAVNACTNKKCGKANGADCSVNADCDTHNCKYVDASSQKCADAGAAGVVASVLLMVATLMTSRIL